MTLTVYTDGGCRNHGNKKNQHVKKTDPAAWAYLITNNNMSPITNTGGQFGKTNNQMELTAIIEALSYLLINHQQRELIYLVSDSKYFFNAIQKNWLKNWVKQKWTNKQGQPIKNQELWQSMVALLKQFANLKFIWVKGHDTNDGNNYVDHLLNETMNQMAPQPNRKNVRSPKHDLK